MSPVYQPMTFDELSELSRMEMKVGGLVKVRPDLMRAMADLQNRLRDDYDRELRKDPESIMCEGANQRRKKADTLVKETLLLRSMKICQMAVRGAMGSDISLDDMCPEEKILYESVQSSVRLHLGGVDRLRGRHTYVDTRIDVPAEEPVVEPEPAEPEPAPAEVISHVEEEPQKEEPAPKAVPAEPDPISMDDIPDDIPDDQDLLDQIFDDPMEAEIPVDDHDDIFMGDMAQPPKPEPPKPEDVEEIEMTMVVLRITEDLPPFVGPDRDYELRREDLITMPKVMADALVRAEKAVVVRPTP